MVVCTLLEVSYAPKVVYPDPMLSNVIGINRHQFLASVSAVRSSCRQRFMEKCR